MVIGLTMALAVLRHVLTFPALISSLIANINYCLNKVISPSHSPFLNYKLALGNDLHNHLVFFNARFFFKVDNLRSGLIGHWFRHTQNEWNVIAMVFVDRRPLRAKHNK